MVLKTGGTFTQTNVRPRAGFTIVELLIVIVVIAILAAIAIVAYNGVSRRAAQSVLKNDLAQTVRLVQNYRTDNNSYPSALASITNGGAKTADTTYEYTSTSSTFCVTASSVKAQLSVYATEGGAVLDGTCPGHFGLNPPSIDPRDMLAMGYYHVCTLAYNDEAYCWGSDSNGQLGIGGTTSMTIPTAMSTSGALSGKRVTSVSGGYQSQCEVADGAVYCQGGQMTCQLGVSTCSAFNTEPNILTPTAVSTSGALNGKTAKKVSVGYLHACTLSTDGGVYCWGQTQYGKLGGGVGNTGSTAVSLAVDSFATGILAGQAASDLSAGQSATCAIVSGLGYCWGADNRGQLGNGTDDTALTSGIYANRPIPIDTSGVLAGRTLTQISIGGNGNDDYGCAIADDGKPYCWGDGSDGRLGDGLSIDSESPVAVDTSGVLAGKTVTHLSVGRQGHACVIADGGAYCWGSNLLYGALGNNNQTSVSPVPVAVNTSGVLSGKTLVAIAAGYSSTCALSDDNNVYCWGQGSQGRLGHGSSPTFSAVPVLVTTP